LLQEYGADITRLFCLFAAPPERDLEWSDQGVEGAARFLNRVWRLAYDWMDRVGGGAAYDGPVDALDGDLRDVFRKIHETIQKVTTDIEDRFHFNTAISAVMELVNALYGVERKDAGETAAAVMRLGLESTVMLLSPMVPHLTEELWHAFGNTESLLDVSWPLWRDDALAKDELLIVVQVNGKLRGRFTVPADADEETLKEKALADEQAQKFMAGKTVRKVIVVKGKLVNIVVG
jgi:leucyl-tRNA synthetase